MTLYYASILFVRGKNIHHIAQVGSDALYYSLEGFVNFCELQAKGEERFAGCGVQIIASETWIDAYGKFHKQGELVRDFKL